MGLRRQRSRQSRDQETDHETPAYFEQHRLGRDHFITLRVPNPTVERAEAKILLETLDSIPRSYDATRALYGDETPPVFEVILPMTTSHKCLDRIYRYYRDFVVAQQYTCFHEDDITIKEWIGEFCPERINVIPLFEAMPHMLKRASHRAGVSAGQGGGVPAGLPGAFRSGHELWRHLGSAPEQDRPGASPWPFT